MGRPAITIYTDGACSPNPGRGGWGAVLLQDDQVVAELSGSEQDTTNNRMELTAALRALAHLDEPYRVTLVTDSNYLKNGITAWIHSWKRRGWLTAAREPVKNRDLWEGLDREIQRHNVEWKWVRGHSLNRWNERADTLAVTARSQVDGQASPDPQSHLPRPDSDKRICIFLGITFSPATGRGSWSAILHYQGHTKAIGGSMSGRSANEFHLVAAMEALLVVKKKLPVTLYTTSGYLRDGLTRWLEGWQRRNWLTNDGRPVSNRSLWQQLAGLRNMYAIEVILTRRDNGYCLLQEAKELAREYSRSTDSRRSGQFSS
jgi:ribonuclease HI